MSRELLIPWPEPGKKFTVEDRMVINGDSMTKPKSWSAAKWSSYVYSMLGITPEGEPVAEDDEDDWDDWDGEDDD